MFPLNFYRALFSSTSGRAFPHSTQIPKGVKVAHPFFQFLRYASYFSTFYGPRVEPLLGTLSRCYLLVSPTSRRVSLPPVVFFPLDTSSPGRPPLLSFDQSKFFHFFCFFFPPLFSLEVQTRRLPFGVPLKSCCYYFFFFPWLSSLVLPLHFFSASTLWPLKMPCPYLVHALFP